MYSFFCISFCVSYTLESSLYIKASQMVLVVNNLSINAGDPRDAGLIPGSGRSPEVGNGNLLRYSCLENPIDREAWMAIVHGVAKSQTQLTTHNYNISSKKFKPGSPVVKNLCFHCRGHSLHLCWGTKTLVWWGKK